MRRIEIKRMGDKPTWTWIRIEKNRLLLSTAKNNTLIANNIKGKTVKHRKTANIEINTTGSTT